MTDEETPEPEPEVYQQAVTKEVSRRKFMKTAGIAGAAGAGGLIAGGLIGNILAAPNLTPKEKRDLVQILAIGQGYPQAGSFLIWYDSTAVLWKARKLADGTDPYTHLTSPNNVINQIITALPGQGVNGNAVPWDGAEIWLSKEVDDDSVAVTINKYNVHLLTMRKQAARGTQGYEGRRPHIGKVIYSFATDGMTTVGVRGGSVRGLHMNEIYFDGSQDQRYIDLTDLSLYVTGATDKAGLRFGPFGTPSVGNSKAITITNLDLYLTGPDVVGVSFGNDNPNSPGMYDFNGRTFFEIADPTTGMPAAFEFSSNFICASPLWIENLVIIEGTGRTAGGTNAAILAFRQKSNSVGSKGMRSLNVGTIFYEQHIFTQAYLFKIESSASPLYFVGSMNDLFVSTPGSGYTTSLINNLNSNWQPDSENFILVRSGRRTGGGSLTLGVVAPHQYFRLYLKSIRGMAEGQIGKAWFDGGSQQARWVGMLGDSGNAVLPGTANVPYTVFGSDIYMAASGGLNGTQPASMLLSDPDGQPMATLKSPFFQRIPVGWKVTPLFTVAPAFQIAPALQG